MKPSDVPGDLVEAARDAWHGYPTSGSGGWAADVKIRTILAAVLPAHRRQVLREEANALWDEIERQVRDKVAAEVAEPTMWPDPIGRWTADQADAARAMKAHITRRITPPATTEETDR